MNCIWTDGDLLIAWLIGRRSDRSRSPWTPRFRVGLWVGSGSWIGLGLGLLDPSIAQLDPSIAPGGRLTLSVVNATKVPRFSLPTAAIPQSFFVTNLVHLTDVK